MAKKIEKIKTGIDKNAIIWLYGQMKQSERALLRAKAKVLKALAHPTRLWMVEKLADGEKCVCEFVDRADVDFSTISRHLTVLREAGIVSSDKRGKQVFYTLKVPCVNNFMHCIEAVIESQARDQFALIECDLVR